MPAKKKAFPEILAPACPPTHFTVEEARRAVLKVREEDRVARETAERARAQDKKGRSAA